MKTTIILTTVLTASLALNIFNFYKIKESSELLNSFSTIVVDLQKEQLERKKQAELDAINAQEEKEFILKKLEELNKPKPKTFI
jgi:anti-anti-sigma regulatory factor